jgi:hypothetical protein
MLAFAHDRRARENNAEHGDVVDDAHDAREPCRVDIGIEHHADIDIDRRQRRAFLAREQILDLGRDDLLRVAGPETGLDHRRRIDIDLNGRRAAAEDIFFEVRRYVDDEGVPPRIHQRNDVALGDRLRRVKIGRQECADDAA